MSVLKTHLLLCRIVGALADNAGGRQLAAAVIAVQDVSCRLPHPVAASEQNQDAIAFIPLDRWDADLAPESNMGGRFGGFVEAWSEFDVAATGITPSEAALMDPQQRVLLEVGAGLRGVEIRQVEHYEAKAPFCRAPGACLRVGMRTGA